MSILLYKSCMNSLQSVFSITSTTANLNHFKLDHQQQLSNVLSNVGFLLKTTFEDIQQVDEKHKNNTYIDV